MYWLIAGELFKATRKQQQKQQRIYCNAWMGKGKMELYGTRNAGRERAHSGHVQGHVPPGPDPADGTWRKERAGGTAGENPWPLSAR